MTEADAYLTLERLRWGDQEPTCPHCGHAGAFFITPANGTSRRTRTGSMSERRVWRCRACRRQFSALTGTPLQGSKVPVATWMRIWRGGWPLSLREVARRYEVDLSTAQAVRRRLAVGVLRLGRAGVSEQASGPTTR